MASLLFLRTRPLLSSRLHNAVKDCRTFTKALSLLLPRNSVRELPSPSRRCFRAQHHDVGGTELLSQMEFPDKPLLAWEQQCHALFVVLASRGILGTDALRRAIEGLTQEQYESWGYYEKWSAAMVILLLEQKCISETELRTALYGEQLIKEGPTSALFKVGDTVRVKPFANSDSEKGLPAVEWRRPHIRTPGYVYGAAGVIERVCGRHGDPSFLAFGVLPAPQVQLYRVRFRQADLWPEQKSLNDDVVEVEIYEHWLEPDSGIITEPIVVKLFDHSETGGDDCLRHHHHDHHHDHGETSGGDGHVHEARPHVEERAIRNEGPPRPGQELFLALLNILTKKGLVAPDDIRAACERLDTAGKQLDGATLVVAAWQDSSFRQRLLNDAAAAASELGIATSNPNAPTVLTVVPNTPESHNLVVCTLCSCYPSGLLGIAPSWYKSRLYRARAVREPRNVLASFGTHVAAATTIRVHDSTADHRYLVLPIRPKGTDHLTSEELKRLVTRDSMVGVTIPRS